MVFENEAAVLRHGGCADFHIGQHPYQVGLSCFDLLFMLRHAHVAAIS